MPVNSVRVSKYRHVYGQPVKKEKCFENIRLTKNAFDSNLASTNGKYVSVCWQASGGGSFAVIPTTNAGKLPDRFPLFDGHKGPVLDTDWNPYDSSMVVSASDDGTIGVWKVPEGFDLFKEFESLEDVKDIEAVKFLKGHTKRVGHVCFNPVAEGILASSSVDNTIKVWDVAQSEVLYTLSHPNFVTSFSWNYDGTKIVTACKDKKLRVWDVRSGKVLSEGPSHAGAKSCRVVWLGDNDRILTTGFSLMSDREMALWDTTDLAKGPIGGFRKQANPSSGIVMPFYDIGTSIVYLGGRGDGNIVYYEFVDDELYDLFAYQSTAPQRGLAFLPDNKLDAGNHEVARFYKIHESFIEPISFFVPRKVEGFLADIYTDVSAEKPALTAKEWASGKSARPLVVSWKDIVEGKKAEPTPACEKPVKIETPPSADTGSAKSDEKASDDNKEEDKKPKTILPKKETTPVELAQSKAEKQESNDALQSQEVKSFLERAGDDEEGEEEVAHDSDNAWDDEPDKASAKASSSPSAKSEPEPPKDVPKDAPKDEPKVEAKDEPKDKPVAKVETQAKTDSVKDTAKEIEEDEVKKESSKKTTEDEGTKKSESPKEDAKEEKSSLLKSINSEIEKLDDKSSSKLADNGADVLHTLHQRLSELENTISGTLKDLAARVEKLETRDSK